MDCPIAKLGQTLLDKDLLLLRRGNSFRTYFLKRQFDVWLYFWGLKLALIFDTPVMLSGQFLSKYQFVGLLNKMQLHAKQSTQEDHDYIFTVFVPPARSDVLQPCDVAEPTGDHEALLL
nr:phenylalanine--tRNA ligase beta subunit, cytoplasmic-like [Tanacetum cinerariifolium]